MFLFFFPFLSEVEIGKNGNRNGIQAKPDDGRAPRIKVGTLKVRVRYDEYLRSIIIRYSYKVL